MIYVSTTYLQAFLLSFACVFYVVAFLWTELRKRKLYAIDGFNSFQADYSQIRKMDNTYKGLSILFMVMIVCYVTLPSIYKLFIPIKAFNNPLLDDIGLLMLNVSLVLIVVAQLDIDKEIYRMVSTASSNESKDLIFYSKRKYIHGILIMFAGIAVIMSNVVATILMITAFFLYKKDFRLTVGKR